MYNLLIEFEDVMKKCHHEHCCCCDTNGMQEGWLVCVVGMLNHHDQLLPYLQQHNHFLSLSLSHTHTHTLSLSLSFFSMPIRDWIRLWISANKIGFKVGLKWWFRRLEKSLPFLPSPGSSYLSINGFLELVYSWVYVYLSISNGAQYVTLQKCFSHSSLVICFFPTPPINLKLGLQIGRRRLIVTHPETNQTVQITEQVLLGFAVPFTSLCKTVKNF
jgi:hypothetical protein